MVGRPSGGWSSQGSTVVPLSEAQWWLDPTFSRSTCVCLLLRYPDSWYRDITSNKKFFSLAATYRGDIVGMIVAEIKNRTKIHKEVSAAMAQGLTPLTLPALCPILSGAWTACESCRWLVSFCVFVTQS